MSNCKCLRDFPYGEELLFLAQAPECIFSKGACHVFAYELRERFTKEGTSAQIYRVPSLIKGPILPREALHLLVSVDNGEHFIDVDPRLRTSKEVQEEHSGGQPGDPILIQDPNVLFTSVKWEFGDDGDCNQYDMLVKPFFVIPAQKLARSYISNNWVKYQQLIESIR